MKKFLVILLVIILVGCEKTEPITIVDDNRGEPLFDIHGEPWRFADYQGKWIIVNYWAGWCKPCITEVPELEAFYQAHHNGDAIVLGVNYDFVSAGETAHLAEKYGMTYPVLASEYDPRLQLGIAPIMVLPTTLIINPEGKVIQTLVGEQTQAGLEEIIRDRQ